VDESRKEKLVKELQGMAVGVAGLFILLSLLTFSAADQSLNSWSTEAGVHNLGGRLGAQVADLCLMLFGLASYLLPGVLLLISYNLLRFKEPRLRFYKTTAFCGLLIALSALFAFNLEVTTVLGQQVPTGGAIGALIVRFLKTIAGTVGALLVLLPLLAASIMVLSGFSFVLFASWWLENLRQKWAARQERRTFSREEQEKQKARSEGKRPPSSGPVIKAAPPPSPRPNLFKREKKKEEAAKEKPTQESFDFISNEAGFHTPPLSLLDPPPATERRIERELLEMNARLLEKKLLDFGIDGEVKEICPGPVITMYEFAPAPVSRSVVLPAFPMT